MSPTPEEERDLRASQWRQLSLAAEIALFVLTIVAVAASYGFFATVDLEKGWLTLFASIATAEWLIRKKRFWRTGVESALWIGGLIAFIFSLPSSGKPEAILVFVAAFALAGWRLRNAVFGTIAFILADVYLAVKDWDWLALVAGVVASIIAAAATVRVWRRVSTELLVSAIAVAGPVATYAAYEYAGNRSEVGVVLVFLIAAIADVAIGIAFLARAPLIASAICVAIACFEARDFIHLATESKLILAGAATLIVATALMRLLRNRTTGLTVAPVKHDELGEAMQIAAMLPVGVAQAPPQETGVQPGGGSFGGAGASGNF